MPIHLAKLVSFGGPYRSVSTGMPPGIRPAMSCALLTARMSRKACIRSAGVRAGSRITSYGPWVCLPIAQLVAVGNCTSYVRPVGDTRVQFSPKNRLPGCQKLFTSVTWWPPAVSASSTPATAGPYASVSGARTENRTTSLISASASGRV